MTTLDLMLVRVFVIVLSLSMYVVKKVEVVKYVFVASSWKPLGGPTTGVDDI